MKTLRNTITNIWNASQLETVVFFAVVLWGGAHAFYVYILGLTTLFVDQNSHLNIARLIVDSLTPGISQLGFWPPLLHILMAPVASITPLFESGLAGAFVLVPVLGVAGVYLYRIAHVLTKSNVISLGSVLLFVTNPYILYYSVTPMTELLFIATLLGTGYYLVRWLEGHSFRTLLYLASFVTLASLARFEGLLLIPVVGIIVTVGLLHERKGYHEIEATSILFGLVAGIGLFFIFIYGIVFGNSPFEFVSGQWSAAVQQESFFLPTAGDLGLSILYMVEASKLMLGSVLVWIALASFAVLLILLRQDTRFLAFAGLSAVLLSPLLFDIFALYQGNAVLYLNDLPPFDGYFNERYGLYWFGFVVLSPMLLIGVLGERVKNVSHILQNATGVVLVAGLILFNGLFLISHAYTNQFSLITGSADESFPNDQRGVAQELNTRYDGGMVLITRALQNYVTVNAGIPLRNYIHESNFEYYEQALGAPWFYARWVVMYNPDILGVEEWRKENERISRAWGNSDTFHLAYELVYENDSERLYRLNDNIVKEVVVMYNMNPEIVPSLNTGLTRWDQSEFYDILQDGIRYYKDSRAGSIAQE